MPAVETLRVRPVEVPHQTRKIGHARVQHQVIVIAHLAVGQHLGVEAFHRLRQHVELGDTVCVIPVDRLAPVSPGSHVIDGTWELKPEGAGHGAMVGNDGGAKGKT